MTIFNAAFSSWRALLCTLAAFGLFFSCFSAARADDAGQPAISISLPGGATPGNAWWFWRDGAGNGAIGLKCTYMGGGVWSSTAWGQIKATGVYSQAIVTVTRIRPGMFQVVVNVMGVDYVAYVEMGYVPGSGTEGVTFLRASDSPSAAVPTWCGAGGIAMWGYWDGAGTDVGGAVPATAPAATAEAVTGAAGLYTALTTSNPFQTRVGGWTSQVVTALNVSTGDGSAWGGGHHLLSWFSYMTPDAGVAPPGAVGPLGGLFAHGLLEGKDLRGSIVGGLENGIIWLRTLFNNWGIRDLLGWLLIAWTWWKVLDACRELLWMIFI